MPWDRKAQQTNAACKVARALLAARRYDLAALQAAWRIGLFTQGIGLRPQPWARISRPVGPVLIGTLSFTLSDCRPAPPGHECPGGTHLISSPRSDSRRSATARCWCEMPYAWRIRSNAVAKYASSLRKSP